MVLLSSRVIVLNTFGALLFILGVYLILSQFVDIAGWNLGVWCELGSVLLYILYFLLAFLKWALKLSWVTTLALSLVLLLLSVLWSLLSPLCDLKISLNCKVLMGVLAGIGLASVLGMVAYKVAPVYILLFASVYTGMSLLLGKLLGCLGVTPKTDKEEEDKETDKPTESPSSPPGIDIPTGDGEGIPEEEKEKEKEKETKWCFWIALGIFASGLAESFLRFTNRISMSTFFALMLVLAIATGITVFTVENCKFPPLTCFTVVVLGAVTFLGLMLYISFSKINATTAAGLLLFAASSFAAFSWSVGCLSLSDDVCAFLTRAILITGSLLALTAIAFRKTKIGSAIKIALGLSLATSTVMYWIYCVQADPPVPNSPLEYTLPTMIVPFGISLVLGGIEILRPGPKPDGVKEMIQEDVKDKVNEDVPTTNPSDVVGNVVQKIVEEIKQKEGPDAVNEIESLIKGPANETFEEETARLIRMQQQVEEFQTVDEEVKRLTQIYTALEHISSFEKKQLVELKRSKDRELNPKKRKKKRKKLRKTRGLVNILTSMLLVGMISDSSQDGDGGALVSINDPGNEQLLFNSDYFSGGLGELGIGIETGSGLNLGEFAYTTTMPEFRGDFPLFVEQINEVFEGPEDKIADALSTRWQNYVNNRSPSTIEETINFEFPERGDVLAIYNTEAEAQASLDALREARRIQQMTYGELFLEQVGTAANTGADFVRNNPAFTATLLLRGLAMANPASTIPATGATLFEAARTVTNVYTAVETGDVSGLTRQGLTRVAREATNVLIRDRVGPVLAQAADAASSGASNSVFDAIEDLFTEEDGEGEGEVNYDSDVTVKFGEEETEMEVEGK